MVDPGWYVRWWDGERWIGATRPIDEFVGPSATPGAPISASVPSGPPTEWAEPPGSTAATAAGPTTFTVRQVHPWHRKAAIAGLVLSGALIGAAVAILAGSDDSPGDASEQDSASPTTAGADAACRAAFAAANDVGTDAKKLATLAACDEGQWVRQQRLTPIRGASLPDLCDVRDELAALACATADSERAIRERTTSARSSTTVPATTLPATTVATTVAPPTSTASAPAPR